MPLTDAPEETRVAVSDFAPVAGSLLVVDDEEGVREMVAGALETFGYTVRTAKDADEALRILEDGGVQLVLTDIDMPGRSGLDLLRTMKSVRADVDVIMMTGHADLETALRSIRDGATDFVTKPFKIAQLAVLVERNLEKRRLVLENRAYQHNLEEMVADRTRELSRQRDQIGTLYCDLQLAYESTLLALVTAVDLRDSETQGHSSRVVEYAVTVAQAMGVDEPELSWIRYGAILHDVGKIGVSDAILRKPGKLDPDEWTQMRRHPEMGYRMLRHISFLEPALDIVLCHQERWDGMGYPRGLKGAEIPLGARIFPVVDTLDAMTSDRPYRRALTIEAAREEVRRYAGTQFDPEVAEVFLSIQEGTWRRIRDRLHRDCADAEVHVRRAIGRSVPLGAHVP